MLSTISITLFALICATFHGHLATAQNHNDTIEQNTLVCSDFNHTHTESTINLCNCKLEKGGQRYEVDCTRKQLNTPHFSTSMIPQETQILLLQENYFEFIPILVSKNLILLDLSGNQLTRIENETFAKLPNLIELDLTHNRIETIESKAFESLTLLKRLDLGHNNLKYLNEQIFKPLLTLEALILSNNRQLNYTLGQPTIGLFTTFGVINTLSRLEINDASLKSLNLRNATGLKEIYLRYNQFTCVPETLPHGVELIDFSGNSFVEINENFLSWENSLRELHLSQMPRLTSIKPNAFHNLTLLRVLDFSGCKQLKEIFPNAFDRLTPLNGSMFATPFLSRINLRGANLQIFYLGDEATKLNWERIDLHNNPLTCDCRVKWIRELSIDTYARCAQPSEMKDILVTNIPKMQFVCRFWPHFVYAMLHSLLLLCILIIGAIPIWLLVILLKPSRRIQLQKIGSTSPYAPITVETHTKTEDYY